MNVWGLEDNLWESVLSFDYVGHGEWTQIVRFGKYFTKWTISLPVPLPTFETRSHYIDPADLKLTEICVYLLNAGFKGHHIRL